MKKTILCFSMLFLSHLSFSQKYEFQTIKDIECTPIISQGATGTCWSFSTTSFLESEIYRTSGKKIDLSEMYNVRYTYLKKAENYVLRYTPISKTQTLREVEGFINPGGNTPSWAINFVSGKGPYTNMMGIRRMASMPQYADSQEPLPYTFFE